MDFPAHSTHEATDPQDKANDDSVRQFIKKPERTTSSTNFEIVVLPVAGAKSNAMEKSRAGIVTVAVLTAIFQTRLQRSSFLKGTCVLEEVHHTILANSR